MEQLPTYSNNKQKGNTAANILKKNLGKFSVINTVDESVDLGIDMRAQVIEKDRPVSLFFNVQCKGKDELSKENLRDEYVSVPIKVSTINYWKQQNDVTLLFVVDNQTERCYWCNPLEQVEKRFNVIQNQLTTNVHVPLDEYIDPFTICCPPQLVRSILWFMTNHLEHVNKYINEFKDGMSSEYKIDIETSVYLLKEINKSAKEIINSYESICENLINNIKKQIHEAYGYAMQLEVIDPMIVHRFCKQGVRKDKGFTKNGKSLEELKKEAEEIVEYFLANKSNTDILDNLVMCDKEIEDLLINLGAFLYEMACEDNPFGDNSELYEKVYNHKWKYH